MDRFISSRNRWLLWLAALGVLVVLALFPVSYRTTRLAELGLGFVVWLGLVALLWQRRAVRWTLLGLTILVAGFLGLPARDAGSPETLRADYVATLQRYNGVTYVWGGENSRGIDCSGLVRRGLIDAMIQRGTRTADAGLVRGGLALWWNDCTASALGAARPGLTMRLLETESVNTLDHTRILPGDLAVTESGLHIMAYLGEQRWIEADPGLGQVVTVTVPSDDNAWFRTPMKIVRWSVLQ